MSAFMAWVRSLGGPPAPAPKPVPPAEADMLGASTLPPAVVRAGVPDEVFHLSKAFEDFSAVPYDDNGKASGGTITIGYGSTRDAAGKPVTWATPPITETEGAALARRDLAEAARLLTLDFPTGLPARWWAVGVLMNNNLGRMGGLRGWGRTLHAHLMAARWREAGDHLRHYRNQRDAAGRLVPLTGLRRRRWAEAAYALGMDPALARKRAWAEINTPDDWPKLPTT